MCVWREPHVFACLAAGTDQNGSAHVVFRRPSKHKMQFACLPFVVAVLLMFALRIRVFFLNGITDRDALHK